VSLDLTKLDNTDDPKEILGILKEYNDVENDRYKSLHHEWEKNVLFFLGKQWLEETPSYDSYNILNDSDDKFRPVSNYTTRLLHLKRSQVLGKGGLAVVKPATDRKDDAHAARLGNLLLKAKYIMDNESFLKSLLFLHSEIFGIGWRCDCKAVVVGDFLEKTEYENVENEFFSCPTCGTIDEYKDICPSCGDKMNFQDESGLKMVLDPKTGLPVITKKPVYRHEATIIDPFRVRVSSASQPCDIRSICISSVEPVEWVKEAYCVEGEGFFGEQYKGKIKKSTNVPKGVKLSEKFKDVVMHNHSSTGNYASDNSQVDDDKKDTLVMHKIYCKPTAKRKMGRLIIWSEDALLFDGKPDVPNNKKLRRWHPLTPYIYSINPLRFEGDSAMSDLIPRQKTINSIDAIIMEHADKTAAPDRVEFGNVQKNNDDNSDGIIMIKPLPELPGGGMPTYLQHPQIANELYNWRASLVQEMKEAIGITDIVQGLHPAGVDTYRGMQLLSDSADKADAEMYNRWFECDRSSSQLKLAILQECLVKNDEELISMMDEIRINENLDMKAIDSFLGIDLKNNLNVSIETSDYMSETVSAEQERLTTFITSGIISPEDMSDPVVRIQILRKLGMDSLPMADKADIEKAERIAELIEDRDFNGAVSRLLPQDNKGLQLRVWSEWIKSARFENLDQEIQMAAKSLITKVENELLQSQQSMQQTPPGAGASGEEQQPTMGVNNV